jgi:hypothetical protein
LESALKAFSDLFSEEYNTHREQWVNALKSELKLEDVSSKIARKHLDLGPWPILSLESAHSHHFESRTPWKKASQTYSFLETKTLVERLKADLAGGTRAFFFYKDFLNVSDLDLISKTLYESDSASEIEVYLLGNKTLTSTNSFKCIDENQVISAREIHEQGGHNVHELAVLTLEYIKKLETNPTHACVFLDSHFFKNIAKVRALKLLLQKVAKESNHTNVPKIITLNSYREWTLFERYSNILRNNVQVASGLIAGADAIQSSGYQIVFDLETDVRDHEHDERSQRMARNTSHILGLESMLGLVDDAAFGSYHLEELTHKYAEGAWKLMQLLLSFTENEKNDFLNKEIQKVQSERLSRLKVRKDVLAGINDYPDQSEKLNITLKGSHSFRVARVFEELRLKVEKLAVKPKVEILIHGELAALNNRVNFIKNYFELIGLEVVDPVHGHEKSLNSIIVLCAQDEDYPELSKKHEKEAAFAKFVASKVEVTGYESIFSGQDVYQVLEGLTLKMAGAQ